MSASLLFAGLYLSNEWIYFNESGRSYSLPVKEYRELVELILVVVL